jgi:hypothetical protein
MATTGRRSLSYIRLAAYLAGQPPECDRLEMSLDDVAEVVGQPLPHGARFPSWWRNSPRRSHSRAWLTAGWEVAEISLEDGTVVFVRAGVPSTTGPSKKP